MRDYFAKIAGMSDCELDRVWLALDFGPDEMYDENITMLTWAEAIQSERESRKAAKSRAAAEVMLKTHG